MMYTVKFIKYLVSRLICFIVNGLKSNQISHLYGGCVTTVQLGPLPPFVHCLGGGGKGIEGLSYLYPLPSAAYNSFTSADTPAIIAKPSISKCCRFKIQTILYWLDT